MTVMKLGMNLLGFNYFAPELPIINILKNAAGWAGRSATPVSASTIDLDLDTNGFVKSMKVKSNPTSSFAQIDTLVMKGLGHATGAVGTTDAAPFYPTGQYLIKYDGTGTVTADFDGVKNVGQSTAGRVVLDVTPSTNGIKIVITASDPGNTGDYVRNMRLIHIDNEAADTAGSIFNPNFLTRARPFKAFRFMDWQSTLGNELVNWADRILPAHCFWGSGDPDVAPTNYTFRGVPVETMVALCNEIGADAWFCMPTLASDDAVTQFATLVRDSLNYPLKVYVEYGNETWNGTPAFSTRPAVATLGAAAFPDSTNDFDRVARYNVKRTIEMGAIWKSVWGAQASRVVRVQGGQHSGSGYNSFLLDKTETYWSGAAYTHIDAFATAPYWGDPCPDTYTLDQLFQELLIGGVSPPPPGGALAGGMIAGQMAVLASDMANTATRTGVTHLCYEGGQNFLDGTHANVPLQLLYLNAQRDARMGTAYTSFLTQMKTLGLTLYMDFNLISASNFFTHWGKLENITDTTSAKYAAVRAVARGTHRARWSV